MRASLIRHVDPWQDAARGAHYEGNLAVDRLPRLSAMAALRAPLQVSLSFRRGHDAGKHGAVETELEVCGGLDMICQRCLGALSVELAVQTSIWVVRDEAAAHALDSSGDTIISPPGERLDVATMVEDEVLLAMPFAARHAAGTCDAHSGAQRDGQTVGEESTGESLPRTIGISGGASRGVRGDGELPDMERGDGKRNPFAVLDILRDHADDNDQGSI
jgi:uncharacterized protein